MTDAVKNIRIGVLIFGNHYDEAIRYLLPYGFESFEVHAGDFSEDQIKEMSKNVKEAIGDRDVVISALGVSGNPLESEEDADRWRRAIDTVHLFGADVVAGFAGRINGQPIDASIRQFKRVFEPLAKRAQDKGVRIAFENCAAEGTWKNGDSNIAHHPEAWEMMFNAVPYDNVGLEWEPCHQMVKLIDPMAQLSKWVKKIFHVHGKDATVKWHIVREYGIGGSKQFAFHRTPGFGDSNWTDIISELRQSGFKGSIDIEGLHDPVYRGELEVTGQVRGLNYLKECRGGEFVPNTNVVDPFYR